MRLEFYRSRNGQTAHCVQVWDRQGEAVELVGD